MSADPGPQPAAVTKADERKLNATPLLGLARRPRALILAILILTALGIAGGVAWYRNSQQTDLDPRERAEYRFQQAREALARGDPGEADILAELLHQQGHRDEAHLIRGEILVRHARAFLEAASDSARYDGMEWIVQLIIDSGSICGQGPVPRRDVQLHSSRFHPAIALLEPRVRQRMELQEVARESLRQALPRLRQVDENSPLFVEAAALAGESIVRLLQMGEPFPLQDTARLLNFVVERQPDNVEAHRHLAAVYLRLNAMSQAIEHLQVVGRLDRFDARPYLAMALVYKGYMQPHQAIEAYKEAIRRDLLPHVKVEAIVELATLLVEQGQYREGLRVLDDCPSEFAQAPVILALRGACLHGLPDRSTEANRWIDLALEKDPDLPQALLLKGKLLMDQGQGRTAIPFFEKVLEQDPHDTKSRQQLAEAYRLVGDNKRADEQLRLRDQTNAYRDELGKLSLQAINKPWDDAVRFQVAEIWLKMNRPAEARNWLQATLLCNSRHEGARKALAQLDGIPPPKPEPGR